MFAHPHQNQKPLDTRPIPAAPKNYQTTSGDIPPFPTHSHKVFFFLQGCPLFWNECRVLFYLLVPSSPLCSNSSRVTPGLSQSAHPGKRVYVPARSAFGQQSVILVRDREKKKSLHHRHVLCPICLHEKNRMNKSIRNQKGKRKKKILFRA